MFLLYFKGDFFSNIGAILTYALLGTTVSAVIVGLTMYGLGLVCFLLFKSGCQVILDKGTMDVSTGGGIYILRGA